MDNNFSDFLELDEGVNDPGIFKAVFLAGGPGSGKSFIVGQTALTVFGLKVINSDSAFETMLKNAGMEATPENIFTTKGQSIRDRAKLITKTRQKGYVDGRLGLVIDGTGKDFAKIQQQATALRTIGYDVAMIFVNTDLDTAQLRNKKRDRTLPENVVEKMWKDVQNNLGKFQNFFGRYMFIVDNSEGANWQGATQSVYRRIGAWTKEPISNHKAKKWINAQKKARNIAEGKEHSWKSEGHYTADGEEWTGPQHAHNGQVMTGEKHTADSKNLYHYKELSKAAQDKVEKKHEKLDEEDIGRTRTTMRGRLGKSSMQRKAEKRRARLSNLAPKDPVKKETLGEAPNWMQDPLAKTLYRTQYGIASKLLKKIIDKKKMSNSMRHEIEYYAHTAARQISDKVDARTLAKMYRLANEEYSPQKHEWGTPEGTAHYKSITPGQEKSQCPKCGCTCGELPCKTCGTFLSKEEKIGDKYIEDNMDQAILALPNDFEFSEVEILQMEDDIDKMTFEDMVDLDMYDEEELEDISAYDIDDEDFDEDEELEISEALSIQGRMKRRFAARRNRQKLKVARMRASRRAADPARIKKRAQRGARNVIKRRFARGRDVSKMPPQEKARIEAMAQRMAPLVARLATRMMPQVRKNELNRIKKGGGGKPQAAKKFKVSKGGSSGKYKAKKFKVKK
jgi:predicted kinase